MIDLILISKVCATKRNSLKQSKQGLRCGSHQIMQNHMEANPSGDRDRVLPPINHRLLINVSPHKVIYPAFTPTDGLCPDFLA